MTNVVIASAARTAVGSFNGSFANTPAHDLGAAMLEALVERAGVEKSDVSETNKEIADRLKAELRKWQQSMKAKMPVELARP